jgi:uncharacterized protein
MTFDWTQGMLAEGLRCYRTGEFFAAHEAWESVWLGMQGPDKTFLQALIQVAAALYHWQRENPEGACSLLHRALRRLERYPAEYGGISVASLSREVHECLPAVETRQTNARLVVPVIRLTM